ncbi:7-carboxy-7-deazaguanine synthase [Sorangium sp. So ce1182]|uniref:7-carboxy-7-deazaguanine synthase n=1 Tax=Sorangium sp. So ce1182 TaxID=3133334 RepID=UPI003F646E58
MGSYSVKEIFYTLQGEGANTGRAAVFCRFSGCNLWSGREKDRSRGPGGCSLWCDTDFVGVDGTGGGKFATAADLAGAVRALWRGDEEGARPLVVCTGGEPLLQLDEPLVEAFHAAGFEVAVETNGTISVPAGVDWVCVSPKAGGKLVVEAGDELKLVYPQDGIDPQQFVSLRFRHWFLQPKDDTHRETNTQRSVEYCQAHPRWRLCLQTHKLLGIP